MGAIIKSVNFVLGTRKGLVNDSAAVARMCLAEAEVPFTDLGMLINAGVYNENHMREPAIASLVQRRIELDSFPDGRMPEGMERLFSYDLHNGGGGIIQALQVLNGFISSGAFKHGMVVAGDATPSYGKTINDNYAPGTGGLLLSNSPEEKQGFRCFRTDAYPEFIDEHSSTISWKDGLLMFEIKEDPGYLGHCVSSARKSIALLMIDEGILMKDIDLIISCGQPSGFARMLSEEKGMGEKVVKHKGSDFYSGGLIHALCQVFHDEQFTSARNILFVNVGAGITVSLALYSQQV